MGADAPEHIFWAGRGLEGQSMRLDHHCPALIGFVLMTSVNGASSWEGAAPVAYEGCSLTFRRKAQVALPSSRRMRWHPAASAVGKD